MKYNNIRAAEFISRPNRFIAEVLIDGKPEICHVKNTGRCRELLIKGVPVWVQENDNSARKTKFDLIAVKKGEEIINIDSYAPNIAAGEWLKKGCLFKDVSLIKPETKWGNSRFDFYLEHGDKKAFIEVKGVTLEKDGIALFPDAPTERGIKHIEELIKAKSEGFEAYLIFVIAMKGISSFSPNYETHKEFGEALKKADKAEVKILAYDCEVTPESMKIDKRINIKL